MKLKLQRAIVTASVGVMALMTTVSGVSAHVINSTTNNFVADSFDNKFATPDASQNQSYWWRTLLSAGATGPTRAENVDCSNAACLTQERNGSQTYARFSLHPQQYPGSINVVDLTEERNAHSYNTPHRWLPTVNHPVVVSARMKFSAGYKADGTGDAVGSQPFWLWNNPLGETGYIAPIKSMGFSWTDSQTFGGFYKGYKITVVDNNVSPFPLYTVDLNNVNMNNWFVATYVWSVDQTGVQSVKFFINDAQVGAFVLPAALPALTLELSMDNQSTQIGPDGQYIFNFRNPSTTQYMDVDFLALSQI